VVLPLKEQLALTPKNTHRFVGVLLALALVLSLSTATANAFTASGKGRTGSSTNHWVVAAIFPWHQSQFLFPARTVSRAGGYSGTQKISAYYQLYVWDGARQTYSYAGGWSGAWWVRRGYRLNLSARGIDVWDFRHYTVNVTFTWRRPSGSLIGARYLRYVHPGDYSCQTGATAGTCILESVGGRTAAFMDGPNSIP
jgi:hypothetical protein